MDISLTDFDGLPAKAYISIRAGETRRQAPARTKEVFRFPSGSCKNLVVDVFEKLGTVQMPLAANSDKPERLERLSLSRSDGTKINVGLKLEMHNPECPPKPMVKANHDEAALQAKNYLQHHGVQQLLQEMVHALLAQKPKKPVEFMSNYLGKENERLAAAPPVDSKIASEPSLATVDSKEYPGFPTTVCPCKMPNLDGHFSLAAEVMKRDPTVYDGLKDLSTKTGTTFAQVIKPGIDSRGHKLIKTPGLIVGDAECYETFAGLIEPVIGLKYGSLAADFVQPLDLSPLTVSPGPVDSFGRFVVSVQVRLSRNLAGLRFPPACSMDERHEAERVLAAALSDLNGDLRGEYHPLLGSDSCPWSPGGMDEDEERLLEGRGIIFAEPDSSVALSSGLGRHWPDARGVYASNSGSMWAWVNEEDHLRLFVGMEGSDLNAAFGQLCRAEAAMSFAVQQTGHCFAHSQRFGYLTANPLNAGTSLQAKVTLKLPLLCRQPDFRSLCGKLKLQAHQGSLGLWHITNAERFGTSEAQQVDSVVKGCRELVDHELRLEQTSQLATPLSLSKAIPRERTGNVRCFAEEPGLGVEEYPGFPTNECPNEIPDISANFSVMTDVLKKDPSIYHRFKATTTKSGVTFAKVIKPGMDVKGHAMIKTMGIVAGDEECYSVFSDLFDEAIRIRHHGFCNEMKHETDLDSSRVDSDPIDPTNKHVVSVKLGTVRNLRGFRFPSACSPDERRELERVLAGALCSLEGDIAGDYYALPGSYSFPAAPGGMSEEQQELLEGAGSLFQEPDSTLLLSSGMGRHWPDARGVFASTGREFTAWVNEEDHLRLLVSERGSNLVGAFARLCHALQAIQLSLADAGHTFVHSERLGFLASCPSNVGAALRATVRVRLPMLSREQDFMDMCRVLHLNARAVAGDKRVWDLANLQVLGLSEVDVLNMLARGVRWLLMAEETLARGMPLARPGLGHEPLPGFSLTACPAKLPSLAGNRSRVARILHESPSIYAALRNKQTAAGVSLSQAIKPGMDSWGPVCQAMPLGLVAGDAECYETFAAVFDPCIAAYRSGVTNVPPPLGTSGMAIDPTGQYQITIRLHVSRNLEGIRFPTACSFDERRDVERTLTRALLGLHSTLPGAYFPLRGSASFVPKPLGMTVEDEEQLRSNGLLFQAPTSVTSLAAGLGRAWPDGRGVFATSDNSLGAWINEDEHISLVAVRQDGNIHAALTTALAAEEAIASVLQKDGHRFAKSSRLGFLTALPEMLGTGISVSVSMRTPGLAARPDLQQLCETRGIRLLGVSRTGVVEVASQGGSLGVSEVAFVDSMTSAIASLLGLVDAA